MRQKRAGQTSVQTLVGIGVVIALAFLLAALLRTGSGTTQSSQGNATALAQQQVQVGRDSNVVTFQFIDRNRRDFDTGLIATMQAWLKEHPSVEVESMGQTMYGGDTRSIILVVRDKSDARKEVRLDSHPSTIIEIPKNKEQVEELRKAIIAWSEEHPSYTVTGVKPQDSLQYRLLVEKDK